MQKDMTFDEVAALAAAAAVRQCDYPEDLAGMVGEMVLWLERHRMPGLSLLANWLDHAGPFDAEKAAPKQEPGQPAEFPDPFIGGMYLVDIFDTLTMPAMIKCPEHGAALMTPFFAMAAHRREIPLEIVFFGGGNRQGEAGRLTYRDGKSRYEGKDALLASVETIGFSKPDFIAGEPREPLADVIKADPAVLARLSPQASA
ncbi:MAG: hypothetical protein KDJ73_02160 [Notoacmeibacter sp.]|nr:hypothetical protein [Notoacmeibacter sp.]